MAVYKTVQREKIMLFMRSHTDRAFSVKEIYDELRRESCSEHIPSESTIYRIMNGLAGSGEVVRTVDPSREYRYTLLGNEQPKIQVKCKHCGKPYEIDDSVSSKMISELSSSCPIDTDKNIEITIMCDKCK